MSLKEAADIKGAEIEVLRIGKRRADECFVAYAIDDFARIVGISQAIVEGVAV